MASLSSVRSINIPLSSQFVQNRQCCRVRVVIPRATLDPSAAFAVTQQTVAFAVVVGAEAAYTGLNTPNTTPGRPTIPTTLAGVGGIVLGAVLTSQGDAIGGAGCATSLAASVFLMLNYIQRVKDTPYDPRDWPGAKAWPAVMILIAFFELAASAQGLLDAFNLLRS